MIDPEVIKELVTDDVIEEALSKIEEEKPQYSGILPRPSVAKLLIERALERLGDHLEVVSEQALGFCACLAPILPKTLEEGYCIVCGNTISILIRRDVA